ncbi:MAG: hypothetical protein QM278_06670 [Pseudomonadota bacterium]|nr:hypothetical protein [Pseudomonadota bacterium]
MTKVMNPIDIAGQHPCRPRWTCRSLTVLLLAAAVALLTACAAKGPPPPPGSLAARFQSDAALFQEGCERLRGVERPKDEEIARQAFIMLTERYPKSKWRGYAELYLRLLEEERRRQEELQELRNGARASREEATAREASLEGQRRELESLLEKGRAETLRLQQENQSLRHENDRLRHNIDSLKRLEIELDRRDKLYR